MAKGMRQPQESSASWLITELTPKHTNDAPTMPTWT